MGNQKLIQGIALLHFFFAPSLYGTEKKLSVFPKQTVPGGVVLIKLAIPSDETSESHPLTVNGTAMEWASCPRTKEKSLCAFVGIPMDDTPPAVEIQVGELSEKIVVGPKTFTKSNLKVAAKHAVLSPENQKRVEKEKEILKAIFLEGSKPFLWKTAFQLPCKGGAGGTMGKFGDQRLFNGAVASTHYGMDLRANQKTPIKSANDGKVVFVGNLFNAGNYVAIDHGGGVYTTYSHLSKFAVKTGDTVKAGQKIGMAGATGRVTGPHLHWSVRVNGLYVDPEEFMTVVKND